MRAQRLARLDVEARPPPIDRDFAPNDVIAAGVVRVVKAAVAGVVPVHCVADGVAELHLDGGPVVEVAVDPDGAVAARLRYRADALVAPDVLSHLHVVVVGVAAPHGLQASVELGVVLVDEEVVAGPAHEWHCLALGGVVLASGPLVPVVDVDEARVRGQGLVPPVLEVDAVALGIIHDLAQPRDICRHGEVLIVQFRLLVLTGPGLADQAYRVLGGSHRRLLADAVVGGDQVGRVHAADSGIAEVVPEAPGVLGADEPLAGPLVVAPPHGAHGEELLHLARVVLVELLGIVGVAVVRVVRVGRGGWVVVRVRVLDSAAVGIHAGVSVDENQRLAVPVEPKVPVLPLLVDTVV